MVDDLTFLIPRSVSEGWRLTTAFCDLAHHGPAHDLRLLRFEDTNESLQFGDCLCIV